MLTSRAVLPANRFVPVPVASSGRLGAMVTAMDQYNRAIPAGAELLSADRMDRVLPPLETAVTGAMVGLMPLDQAAEVLLNLRHVG